MDEKKEMKQVLRRNEDSMSKKPIFELFKLLCSKLVRLRKLGLEHIFTVEHSIPHG